MYMTWNCLQIPPWPFSSKKFDDNAQIVYCHRTFCLITVRRFFEKRMSLS